MDKFLLELKAVRRSMRFTQPVENLPPKKDCEPAFLDELRRRPLKKAQERQLNSSLNIENPLEQHIQAVRAKKAMLKKPDYRSECGVIIIE